jgi:hypothetical protein
MSSETLPAQKMSAAKESESEAEFTSRNDEVQTTNFGCQKEDIEKHVGHNNEPLQAASKPHLGDAHNTIDWDGPEDPQNPMNWSSAKKVTNIGTISVLAFLSYVFSTPQRGSG